MVRTDPFGLTACHNAEQINGVAFAKVIFGDYVRVKRTWCDPLPASGLLPWR